MKYCSYCGSKLTATNQKIKKLKEEIEKTEADIMHYFECGFAPAEMKARNKLKRLELQLKNLTKQNLISSNTIISGGIEFIITAPGSKNIENVWKNVLKEDTEYVEQLAEDENLDFEDAAAYSGTSLTFDNRRINIQSRKTFQDYNEAKNYILNNHEKYENPIAVKYNDGKKLKWMIGGWAAS